MSEISGDSEQSLLQVNKMAESAGYIAYHTFDWQFATSVLFNATFFNIIGNFVEVYGKNVKLHTISKIAEEKNFVDDTEQYVLFLNDIADILFTLKTLKLQKFNPNSKFIIICDDYTISDTIQILWSYRIVNVIFMRNEDSIISGYTYFPSADCDHPTPERLNLDGCIHSYEDTQQSCTARLIFPVKLMNFHRCPLFVSTFEINPYMIIKDGQPSGTDGDLLKITIAALNASLVLFTPEDGMGWGIRVNNSWNGVLGDIQNNLANVSITCALMNLERYRDFDMSMSYNTLSMVWLVHPLEIESASLKLLKPFTKAAWYFIFISFIIFALSHYIFGHKAWRFFSEGCNLGEFSHHFFVYTVQITLGVTVTKYPVNFCKHLIVYWIWYWFLVRIFFQVNLIHYLQTDAKISNINDIQDAIDQEYELGSGKAVKDYYTNNNFTYTNWVIVNVSEIQSTMHKLNTGIKFMFGTNAATAKVFQRNTHINLHTLPKKIFESYCVAYFKKNSSMTRPINLVLTRLFEAGIAGKIFKDYTSVLPEYQDNSDKQITLNHFTGCFALLILGWVSSLVVFILEHLSIMGIKNKLLHS